MWMRGGTSKGGYFLSEDMPADRAARDAFLLRAMGSPDPRQIEAALVEDQSRCAGGGMRHRRQAHGLEGLPGRLEGGELLIRIFVVGDVLDVGEMGG